jgi:hypothetical protein
MNLRRYRQHSDLKPIRQIDHFLVSKFLSMIQQTEEYSRILIKLFISAISLRLSSAKCEHRHNLRRREIVQE